VIQTPRTPVHWPTAYRVVSSLESPIAALNELVESPEELQRLLEIESLTNRSGRKALAMLGGLAPEDYVVGRHAALVMTPFLLPTESRFSPGTYGVLYAGDALETAAREAAYHRGRVLAASGTPPLVQPLEVYSFSIAVDGELHDVRRSARPAPPQAIYDRDDYGAAQKFATRLRGRDGLGSSGLIYDSVRCTPNECVAIFRPRCARNPRLRGRLFFHWNGHLIDEISQPKDFSLVAPRKRKSRK